MKGGENMKRGELGNVLSAQMQTRTLLAEGYEGEVTYESEIMFIENDEHGVLNIYCKPDLIETAAASR